jgi:hypothetical protein
MVILCKAVLWHAQATYPINIVTCVGFPWQRGMGTVTWRCSGTLLCLLSNATIPEGLSAALLRTRQ